MESHDEKVTWYDEPKCLTLNYFRPTLLSIKKIKIITLKLLLLIIT